MFGGIHNSKSYLLKASVNYELGYHEDISTTNDFPFVKSTTITLNSQTSGSFTVNPLPLTPSTEVTSIVKLLAFENSSDRYIVVGTQDLGTISSCSQKSVTLDLTCSLSGNTDISHSLVSDFTSSPPSWISLNSNTGVLSMTTPNLTAATSYQFYVKSAVSGDSNTYQKLIKLTVDKYVYVKRQVTNEVKANTYSTQAVMAVGVVF